MFILFLLFYCSLRKIVLFVHIYVLSEIYTSLKLESGQSRFSLFHCLHKMSILGPSWNESMIVF